MVMLFVFLSFSCLLNLNIFYDVKILSVLSHFLPLATGVLRLSRSFRCFLMMPFVFFSSSCRLVESDFEQHIKIFKMFFAFFYFWYDGVWF